MQAITREGFMQKKWKWIDRGGSWELQDTGATVILDDGSACGEYNRVIEPDSYEGRLVAAAPDMLAMLKELRVCLQAEIDATPMSYEIYRTQFQRATQLINQIEG